MTQNNNKFTAYSLVNNQWQPYGYLSTEDCIIYDRNGNACFRYDSGWLVSFRGQNLYRVDQQGKIYNISNQVTGLIGNYSELPADINKSIYKDYNKIFWDAVLPVLNNSTDKAIIDYKNSISDLNRADSIARNAYNNSPENSEYIILFITHQFVLADALAGKYGRMSDAGEDVLRALNNIYMLCNKHLSIQKYNTVILKIRDLIYYLMGEYHVTHNHIIEAEQILNNVNVDLFPYKAVLMSIAIAQKMNDEYERTGNLS